MRLVCRSEALSLQVNRGDPPAPSMALLFSIPMLGHAPKTTKSLPLHGGSWEISIFSMLIGVGSSKLLSPVKAIKMFCHFKRVVRVQ